MNLEKVVKRRTLRDRYAANDGLNLAIRFEVGYILVNIILLAALAIYVVATTPEMNPLGFLTGVILPYGLPLSVLPLSLGVALILYSLLKAAKRKDWPWLSAVTSLVIAVASTIAVAFSLLAVALFSWAVSQGSIDFSPLAELNSYATTLLNMELIGIHVLVTLACVSVFVLFLALYVQMIRGWISFVSAFKKIPGASLYVYDTTVVTYDPRDADQLQFVASMLRSTGNYQSDEELKEVALDPDALIRVALRAEDVVGATIHASKSRKLQAVKSIKSGSDLNFDILLEDSFYLQSERTSSPEGKVAYNQVLERSASKGGWIATRSEDQLILHRPAPVGP